MASRFLVATGNWDNVNTAIWSASSGGAPGASAPTIADDVVMDAASGAVTVTVTDKVSCNSLTATGFTGTLAGASTLRININTSLALGAGMTNTFAGAFQMQATTAGNTVTSNGKNIAGSIVFSGSTAAVWTVLDAMNVTGVVSTGAVVLVQGSLTTGAFTHNWSSFNGANSNVRTLDIRGSTINLGNGVTSAWGLATVSNLTFLALGSTLNFANGTLSIGFGNLAYGACNFSGATSGTISITGNDPARSFTDFSVSPANVNSNSMVFSGGMTVTNSLTLTGPSLQNRGAWISSLPGSQRAITYTGTALNCNISNWDFQDMVCTGFTWPGDAGNIGDRGNNSGVTARSVQTYYVVLATANKVWTATNTFSTSSGGGTSAANFPLPQDTVIIDASSVSGSHSLTINYPTIPTINASAAPAGFTLTDSTSPVDYGDVTLAAAMTFTAANPWTFSGRGSRKLTSAGKLWRSVTINVGQNAGTLTLQDSLSCTAASGQSLFVSTGGFNSNAKAVTAAALSSSTTNIRTITLDGSAMTLTGAVSTCFQLGTTTTGLTWSAVGTTWVLNTTGATNYSWNLANAVGLNLGSGITVAGNGTGSVGWALGSFTIGTLTNSHTGPLTALFAALQTFTITTAWAFGGSAGNVVTIQSGGSGLLCNINWTGGGIVSTDYLALKDCQFIPNGYGYAGANSVNNGDNPGWIFGIPLAEYVASSMLLGVGG